MIAKLVVLIGLVGYVSAVCQCTGKTASFQEIWQNASIVAHVKIDKVNRPNGLGGLGTNNQNNQNSRQNGEGNQNGGGNQNEVTYDVTFIEVFKPKGSSNSTQPKTLTTPSSTLDCGVPFLVQGSEYLIAGKRQGNSVEITTCSSFPLIDNGIQTGPSNWNGIPQDLKKKLESGSF